MEDDFKKFRDRMLEDPATRAAYATLVRLPMRSRCSWLSSDGREVSHRPLWRSARG